MSGTTGEPCWRCHRSPAGHAGACATAVLWCADHTRGLQMRHAICLIACVGALAACNKGPNISVKNASAGEVAEKVREAGGSGSFIDPGRWETKVSLLDVDIPGM